MTKQIRRNAPAGAEYYSIVGGEVCYYTVRQDRVCTLFLNIWIVVDGMSKDDLLGDDFHRLRAASWKEWVWSIVFVLGFVTVLGVVYG